jgi:hypothetical protein
LNLKAVEDIVVFRKAIAPTDGEFVGVFSSPIHRGFYRPRGLLYTPRSCNVSRYRSKKKSPQKKLQ